MEKIHIYYRFNNSYIDNKQQYDYSLVTYFNGYDRFM